MKIRKAVLPVAGLGTRVLPASKVIPKEMLPLVDKPTLQYIVEEAVAAGIEEIIFVTSRSKRSIEDHFDMFPELEMVLERKGKQKELEEAPSDLAVAGRYILTPDIFEVLEKTPPGKGGEIQVTDAIEMQAQAGRCYGLRFTGIRYDTGTPLGLLTTSIAYALKRFDIGL